MKAGCSVYLKKMVLRGLLIGVFASMVLRIEIDLSSVKVIGMVVLTGNIYQGEILMTKAKSTHKSFEEFTQPQQSKAEVWLVGHMAAIDEVESIIKKHDPPFNTLYRYMQSELDFPYGKTALHTALSNQGIL